MMRDTQDTNTAEEKMSYSNTPIVVEFETTNCRTKAVKVQTYQGIDSGLLKVREGHYCATRQMFLRGPRGGDYALTTYTNGYWALINLNGGKLIRDGYVDESFPRVIKLDAVEN